jgi:hypothetical protein
MPVRFDRLTILDSAVIENWENRELVSFLSAFRPFEHRIGIDILHFEDKVCVDLMGQERHALTGQNTPWENNALKRKTLNGPKIETPSKSISANDLNTYLWMTLRFMERFRVQSSFRLSSRTCTIESVSNATEPYPLPSIYQEPSPRWERKINVRETNRESWRSILE